MESPTSQSSIERHSEHSGNSPEEKDWVGEVRTLLSEKMLIAVDSPDTNLLEAGLIDSLLIVELLAMLEQQCGIAVPMMEVDIQDFSSVRRIAQLLESSACASGPMDACPGE